MAFLLGTTGNDTIHGTVAGDTIRSGAGHDLILGDGLDGPHAAIFPDPSGGAAPQGNAIGAGDGNDTVLCRLRRRYRAGRCRRRPDPGLGRAGAIQPVPGRLCAGCGWRRRPARRCGPRHPPRRRRPRPAGWRRRARRAGRRDRRRHAAWRGGRRQLRLRRAGCPGAAADLRHAGRRGGGFPGRHRPPGLFPVRAPAARRGDRRAGGHRLHRPDASAGAQRASCGADTRVDIHLPGGGSLGVDAVSPCSGSTT